MPNFGGYRYCLCFIEKLTKFPYMVAVKDITTDTLAREFFVLTSLFGAPLSVLSDRGAAHITPVFRKLCEILKVKRLLTSSYKPSSNGITENLNKTLIQRLKSELMGQINWTEKIPFILYAMRATPSTKGSQLSPYHLVFGQEMWLPADPLFMQTNREMLGTDAPTSVKGKKLLEYLEALKPKLQLLHQICAENNKIAQNEQAKQFDKKALSRSFCEGTKVLLYRNYVKPGEFGKTMIRYTGPYIVVSRISRDLYMIRDANTMKMHVTPVDVTKLKLFRPQITNLEQFKKGGPAENILAGPTHQLPVEENTYEFPADSEDEEEKIEGGGDQPTGRPCAKSIS